MLRRLALASWLASALSLIGSPTALAEPPAPTAPIVPAPVEPTNVDDLKADATACFDSGRILDEPFDRLPARS